MKNENDLIEHPVSYYIENAELFLRQFKGSDFEVEQKRSEVQKIVEIGNRIINGDSNNGLRKDLIWRFLCLDLPV